MHQDLVAVVPRAEAQDTGAPPGLPPAETAVELLQPGAPACGEVKLFEAQFLAGDLADVPHQGAADAASSQLGVGLDVVAACQKRGPAPGPRDRPGRPPGTMAYDAPRVRPPTPAPRSRAVPHALTHDDVQAAAERIAGQVRPVAVAPLDLGAPGTPPPGRVHAALEFAQFTGSFKARGAANFIAAHREAGTLPEAGVTIASGGNAGLACAWAARAHGVRATVFLPATAPAVKVERLRRYGAEVRLTGSEYAEALAACETYATESGALASHAYDHPFIAAGAGTLVDEIRAQLPSLDTLVVAAGGGGLFAGVATAARHHGLRTVSAEPEGSRALHAALAAGGPVDVPVDSVAADSLGARRAGQLAHAAAQYDSTRSVLVTDDALTAARHTLWAEHRFAVEHGAATALAALTDPSPGHGYSPAPDETVCVVLCGANTDPATLSH